MWGRKIFRRRTSPRAAKRQAAAVSEERGNANDFSRRFRVRQIERLLLSPLRSPESVGIPVRARGGPPRACGVNALANNPKPLSRSPVAHRPPGRTDRRLTPRGPPAPARTPRRAPARRIYMLGQQFVYPPASARPHGCDLTLTATWAISPEITTRAIGAVTAKRFPLCIGGALKAPPQDKH